MNCSHMNPVPYRVNRRNLLKATLACAGAPMFLRSRVFGANAPSQRITLGCIGMGGQGTGNNLRNFLQQDDAHIVAVCDVFAEKRERAGQMVDEKYGTHGCKSVADFREIIADTSIDAVVISTPDHWHVPMSLLALEAGKHVFC